MLEPYEITSELLLPQPGGDYVNVRPGPVTPVLVRTCMAAVGHHGDPNALVRVEACYAYLLDHLRAAAVGLRRASGGDSNASVFASWDATDDEDGQHSTYTPSTPPPGRNDPDMPVGKLLSPCWERAADVQPGFKQSLVTSADQCIAICLNLPMCHDFLFDLKTRACALQDQDGSILYVPSNGPPPRLSSSALRSGSVPESQRIWKGPWCWAQTYIISDVDAAQYGYSGHDHLIEHSHAIQVELFNQTVLLRVPCGDMENLFGQLIIEQSNDGYGLGQWAPSSYNPGDVMLDIGAHVGLISILMAKQFPGLEVFLFEPIPDTYRHLVANILSNLSRRDRERMHPYNYAMCKKAGEAWAAVNSCSLGSQLQVEDHKARLPYGRAAETIPVQCMPFGQVKEMLPEGRSILLAKMDCEGCELDVLSEHADWFASPVVKRFVGEMHFH